jgi:hypothetical protein
MVSPDQLRTRGRTARISGLDQRARSPGSITGLDHWTRSLDLELLDLFPVSG